MNPIIKYKTNNPEITWNYMAEKVGVSFQYLHKMKSFDKEEMRKVSLGMYEDFKIKLHIDLLDFKKE